MISMSLIDFFNTIRAISALQCENSRLEAELADAKTVISALVLEAGGSIEISDVTLRRLNPSSTLRITTERQIEPAGLKITVSNASES